MMPGTSLAIDRVHRIEPRVQERPERRKPGDKLPDKGDGKTEKQRAPAEPRAPRADDDESEPLVDILVRGRWLPTGQLLPGRGAAAPAS